MIILVDLSVPGIGVGLRKIAKPKSESAQKNNSLKTRNKAIIIPLI